MASALAWSVLAGAALSGLLALAIGAVAFRLRSLRGEIFALLTLAVPFILASVASINRSIDGGQGTTIPLPSVPDWIGGFPQLLFVLDAAVAIGALAIACAVQHGRLGWGLTAIRDAEDVAEGVGVGTLAYKMWAILLSGLIGGLSGALYALQIGFVTVEGVFGLTIPLYVIVMSVLGGRTHWLGPAIGALLIVTLQDRLAASGYTDWNPIVLGAVLAVLVIVAPDGLYGRMRARPWAALGALVVPIVAGYWTIPYGDLQNWVLAGMLLASLVAVVPARWLPARLTRPPRPERVPAIDRPTPARSGAAGTGRGRVPGGGPPTTAACTRLRTSRSPSQPASWSASSGPTGQARPPWSTCSRARPGRPGARSRSPGRTPPGWRRTGSRTPAWPGRIRSRGRSTR